MATNHSSLQKLSKSILNKLENKKYIVFQASDRNKVQDELYTRLQRNVWTEEDVIEKVRGDVEKHSDKITDQNITETAAFQSQKKAIKADISEHELHGFYFISSLRTTVIDVRKFLFDCKMIEDVFESDEAIDKLVLETVQAFDESKIA